jgi:hypothetical protein
VRKFVLVLVTVAALAAPQAASASGGVVLFKLLPESEVLFGDPTDACPGGTKEIDMSSSSGRVIGRQRVCTLRSKLSADRLVEVNTVEFDFRRGNVIRSRARAVFSFSDDPSRATFTATGTVKGGTGRYAGARGRLFACGPVEFDESGAPHLNVTSIIALR